MAINNTANIGTQTASAFAQANQAPQQPLPPSSNRMTSLSRPFINPFIAKTSGNETTKELAAAIGKIFNNVAGDIETNILMIDNTVETSLAFSALVVCMRYKSNPSIGVAFHTTIIESSGKKLQPVYESVNNVQVEIFLTAGDAYDKFMIDKVSEKVSSAYPQSRIYNTEAQVIHRSFNITDVEQVQQVAWNISNALVTELSVHSPGFVDFTLPAKGSDGFLAVQIDIKDPSIPQTTDYVGEVRRDDVRIEFFEQKNNSTTNRSVNDLEQKFSIGVTTCFPTIIWTKEATASNYNQFQQGQVAQIPKIYAAQMVITSMDNYLACTPSAVILSLVPLLLLREDNNWIPFFQPKQTIGNQVDIHDIGAVGIEANFENSPTGFGKRIATKADSFRPESLGQLIGTIFQSGLVYSFDVEECGADTWYTSILSAASNGSIEATNALYDAANQLTSNAFGRYFKQGTQMFTDLGNRIHLGFYIDSTGAKRDIRDIDYLAVMNIVGEKDPKAIRDWSDTFTRTQFPLAMRMSARKKMIMALTGHTAEITGYAHRVTFTAAFLDALAQACREVGLSIRPITPMNGADYNNERGVGSFAASALSQPGQPSIFNRGGNMGGNTSNGYGQQSARFTR